MAFSGITTRGSAVSNSSGTTLAVSPSANLAAGLLAIVCCASDNNQTSDGASTFHTVTDSKSNTWTKVCEYTETDGSVDDGATVSVWATKVTTQILTSDTITLTLGAAKADKIISVMEVTMGSGKTFAIQQVGAGQNSLSASVASMPAREYLLIGAGASEGEDNSKTADGDYTERFDLITSTTGNLDVNIALHVQTRIATLTGDTVTSSAWTNTNVIQTLSALYEIDEDVGGSDVEYSSLVGANTNRGFTGITVPVAVRDNPNRFMVIGIGAYAAGGENVSGVTVDGVAATVITNQLYYGIQRIALYGFIAPNIGFYDVVVSFSGTTNSASVGVAVFYNVDQTTPFSGASEVDAADTTVSSATGNKVVDLIVFYPENSYSPDAGQTQICNLNDNPGDPGTITGMSYKDGETTTAMAWTPDPAYPAIAAVNLNAAPVSRRIFIIS